MELANRLLFRLYQCANMLHKTGTRAVEAEGLTTQQWAVLGALSRERARDGMALGELARYLMVSRQNLSGVVGRMERDGHVAVVPDTRDRRSRVVRMTTTGRRVWNEQAWPKILAYYDDVLADFSIDDAAHALHYLLKMLDNMKRLDEGRTAVGVDADDASGEDEDPPRPSRAAARPRAARARLA
jgi:DNA-binding MarR family transcriptional regulator